MLADGAGGNFQGLSKLVGGRFTPSFQRNENAALSCRWRDAPLVHLATLALLIGLPQFRKMELRKVQLGGRVGGYRRMTLCAPESGAVQKVHDEE